ncbi:MAG: methyltransferase domain-containing protein [Desulfarculaceae bacterium]|jgi:ubiquinone/menaquinone biosynthesis C-methylase UbiE
MNNLQPYEPLRPLMKEFGATGSPKKFYWAVNEAFHTAESEIYDEQHQDMYEELGPAWSRLLSHLPPEPEHLNFLDVGSGTGLVGYFLNQLVPQRVASLNLLDPNSAMLQKARQKSRSWAFPCHFHQGELQSLPHPAASFHVITICSVLHHVVELEPFLAWACRLLKPGGVILTAQDPRAEAGDDAILKQRRSEIPSPQSPGLMNLMRRRASSAIRSLIGRPYPLPPLAEATNAVLMEKGQIRRPLPLESIWAVTDFHVAGQPGGIGHGISQRDLRKWLKDMEQLDYFSYQFFGVPWTRLSPSHQEKERALFEKKDLHGQEFASAWRLAASQ